MKNNILKVTILDFTRYNAQEIELHKSIQDFSLRNECLEHKHNLVILFSDETPILTIKLKEYDEDQESLNMKIFHLCYRETCSYL